MSIFTNNITPIQPTNRSWNKIGYEEWIAILNQKRIDRWRPENMWFSNYEDAIAYRREWRPVGPWNKNYIKRNLHQMKHLNRELQESIDKVQDTVYQKYGVWVKYKIQYGDNKRIKSIVFYRFC